jgi:hypothetical protein
VTVLASLNTSYYNNIIVKHFRGLVLGLPMYSSEKNSYLEESDRV